MKMSRGGLVLCTAVLLIAAFSGCLAEDDLHDHDGHDHGPPGSGGRPGSGNGGNIDVQPPVAVITVETNGTILVGDEVVLNGTASSDPSGGNLTYAWDLGDNTTATGAIVTHTFEAAGSYNITLNVTSESGQSALTTTALTVEAPAPPDFQETQEGALTAPNPAPLTLGSSATLADYKTRGGVEGVTYELHQVTGAPLVGNVRFSHDGGTGVVIVIFDEAGARIAGTSFPSGAASSITLPEDKLKETYQVFVFSAALPDVSYTLTVASVAPA